MRHAPRDGLTPRTSTHRCSSAGEHGKSPAITPLLNSEHPGDLFDPPEFWLESNLSMEDEESQPLSQLRQRGRTRSAPKENPWWNVMYKKEVLQAISPSESSADFSAEMWSRIHVAKHVVLQHSAFIVFVLLSANDTILKSKSKRRIDGEDEPRDFAYAPSSVLLVAGLVSVSLGSLTAAFHHGVVGLQRCWEPRLILRLTPVSILFQLGTVLKFISLKYLPPDMVVVLSQMNLVLLAVTMRFILGKRYNTSQWIALTITSLATQQYLTIRDGRHKGDFDRSPAELSANVMTGMLVLVVMCFVETLASVFAERYLKDRGGKQEAFYIQKVHIDFAGFIFSALWCYVLEPFVLKDMGWSCKPHRCRQVIDEGLFSGWDSLTVAVLGMVVAKLWISAFVAKVLDSVVKQVGSCLAMLVTYVEVMWLYPEKNPFDFDTAVALAVVIMSIASFAVSTRDSNRIERLSTTSSGDAGNWPANYARP